MDGADILDRTRAAYAQLTTYHDTGEVTSSFGGSMSFSTWFARPDSFRFEYKQGFGSQAFQKRCTVWQRHGVSGAEAWWMTGPKIPGLELGTFADILGFAGMHSHSAATRVPRLLMPELFKGKRELVVAGAREESVGGDRCFALDVQWTNANGTFGETWWVGASDALIRRVGQSLDLNDAADFRERLKEQIKDKALAAGLDAIEPDRLPSRLGAVTNYAPVSNIPIPAFTFDVSPEA